MFVQSKYADGLAGTTLVALDSAPTIGNTIVVAVAHRKSEPVANWTVSNNGAALSLDYTYEYVLDASDEVVGGSSYNNYRRAIGIYRHIVTSSSTATFSVAVNAEHSILIMEISGELTLPNPIVGSATPVEPPPASYVDDQAESLTLATSSAAPQNTVAVAFVFGREAEDAAHPYTWTNGFTEQVYGLNATFRSVFTAATKQLLTSEPISTTVSWNDPTNNSQPSLVLFGYQPLTSGPTVDGGVEQTITEGQPLTITATITHDPLETITQTQWTVQNAGATELTTSDLVGATTSTVKFRSPGIGVIQTTITLRCTVTQSDGQIAYDDVQVIINGLANKVFIRMDADQYGPQSWRPAAATTTTPPVDPPTVLSFDLSKTSLGQQTNESMRTVMSGWTSTEHVNGASGMYVTDGSSSLGPNDNYDGARGRVMAVTHPPGVRYNDTWSGIVRFPDMREGWLRYWIMYSTSWNINKAWGKVWGLGGVSPTGSATGPEYPPMHGSVVNEGDGWSARRVTFRGRQTDGIYIPGPIYRNGVPLSNDNRYSAYWFGTDYAEGNNEHVTVEADANYLDGASVNMVLGQWMYFEQYVNIDTGEIKSYMDGVLASNFQANNRLIASDADINTLCTHSYIGSEGSSEFQQDQQVWTYFSDPTVEKIR